jgi:hypothetical protein
MLGAFDKGLQFKLQHFIIDQIIDEVQTAGIPGGRE